MNYMWPESGLWFVPLIYLQLLTLAELLSTMREPRTGLVLHGVILVAILIHGALESNIRNRRFLLSLSLAPLIRILNLTLVQFSALDLSPIFLYAIVGLPLFVAAAFTIQILGLKAMRIGIAVGNFPRQLLFGLTGIVFGYIEYLILRPRPVVSELSLQAIVFPAFILAIFTGLLEELIFRGIIQQASLASYGRFGITYGALVFAVLHVGYSSFLDVVFVFVVAMIFGLVVQKTGSLVGVTISHSLTNIGLLIVFPFLVGFPSQTTVPQDIGTPTASAITTIEPVISTPVFLSVETSTGESEDGAAEQTSTLTPAGEGETTAAEFTPTPIAIECVPPAGWVEYTVQPGDSLFGISQRYGVSLAELRGANCLGADSLIRVGQILYVPYVATNTSTPKPTPTPTRTPAKTKILPTATATHSETPSPTSTSSSTPTQTP